MGLTIGRKFLEVIVGIETGAMPVAEIEANGVIADDFPAGDGDAGEGAWFVATVSLAENITFALGFGAGGSGAQLLTGIIGLGAVVPNDGDFLPDELDVTR